MKLQQILLLALSSSLIFTSCSYSITKDGGLSVTTTPEEVKTLGDVMIQAMNTGATNTGVQNINGTGTQIAEGNQNIQTTTGSALPSDSTGATHSIRIGNNSIEASDSTGQNSVQIKNSESGAIVNIQANGSSSGTNSVSIQSDTTSTYIGNNEQEMLGDSEGDTSIEMNTDSSIDKNEVNITNTTVSTENVQITSDGVSIQGSAGGVKINVPGLSIQ